MNFPMSLLAMMNFPMSLLSLLLFYASSTIYITCYFCYFLLLLLSPPNLYLPPNLLLVPAMADMVSEVAGQGARPAHRWTVVMSGFVLHRFVVLIGNGVKTDKGFKEIHLNSVAKNVSEFCG
jgi:hypothetical protein